MIARRLAIALVVAVTLSAGCGAKTQGAGSKAESKGTSQTEAAQPAEQEPAGPTVSVGDKPIGLTRGERLGAHVPTSAVLLTALLGYIAFFAFSQGSVIWVFISEIFPNAVRAKGQALGWFTHWAVATPIIMLFPNSCPVNAG